MKSLRTIRVLLVALLLAAPRAVFAQNAALSGTTCPGSGCVDILVSGFGAVGIQVVGTFSGTLTFTQTNTPGDAGTYVPLTLYNVTAPSTGVTTATGAGLFTGTVAGVRTVRVAFTAYSSGTARVYAIRTSARATGPPSSGGGSWGAITGTLADQTDLQSALNGKLADDITAGATNEQNQLKSNNTQYPVWMDDPDQADFGLFRFRNTNQQIIGALYNPLYPKYTPDAQAFERAIVAQWNIGDPANPFIEIGSEWGPTVAVTSITRSSSTATVTQTAHGYRTGDVITIAGADQTEYNIDATITVVDADTYTYTVSGTPGSPASGGPITATGGAPRPLSLAAAQVRHGPYSDALGDTFVFDSEALIKSYAGLLLIGPEPAYNDGDHYPQNIMQVSLGTVAGLVQVRGNGTAASPTAAANGDALGVIEFDGLTLDGSDLVTTSGAAGIVAFAEADFTSINSTPARLSFYTTPADSPLGETEVFRLNADGTAQFLGGTKSADGSVGVTVTTCTAFKNGLCVSGS